MKNSQLESTIGIPSAGGEDTSQRLFVLLAHEKHINRYVIVGAPMCACRSVFSANQCNSRPEIISGILVAGGENGFDYAHRIAPSSGSSFSIGKYLLSQIPL